jgi:hypothetical protein
LTQGSDRKTENTEKNDVTPLPHALQNTGHLAIDMGFFLSSFIACISALLTLACSNVIWTQRQPGEKVRKKKKKLLSDLQGPLPGLTELL